MQDAEAFLCHGFSPLTAASTESLSSFARSVSLPLSSNPVLPVGSGFQKRKKKHMSLPCIRVIWSFPSLFPIWAGSWPHIACVREVSERMRSRRSLAFLFWKPEPKGRIGLKESLLSSLGEQGRNTSLEGEASSSGSTSWQGPCGGKTPERKTSGVEHLGSWGHSYWHPNLAQKQQMATRKEGTGGQIQCDGLISRDLLQSSCHCIRLFEPWHSALARPWWGDGE